MKTGSLKAALFFRTKAVFFYIKKYARWNQRFLCTHIACSGVTLRKTPSLPFCPSFSWLGKTDSAGEIPPYRLSDISRIIKKLPKIHACGFLEASEPSVGAGRWLNQLMRPPCASLCQTKSKATERIACTICPSAPIRPNGQNRLPGLLPSDRFTPISANSCQQAAPARIFLR